MLVAFLDEKNKKHINAIHGYRPFGTVLNVHNTFRKGKENLQNNTELRHPDTNTSYMDPSRSDQWCDVRGHLR